jgi:nascent polypeptide-associated complex subunit beta
MTINPDKLAKLQAQSRIGGKGTPRRKLKKTSKASNDDKKLKTFLKKSQAQSIPSIDEVNFFMENGTVLHFTLPKISVVPGANTYIISGEGEEKDITELLPGILSQLGPDSLNDLRRMAEEMSKETQ